MFRGDAGGTLTLITIVVIVALLLVGCSQKMDSGPRYNTFAASSQFPNGQSAQPLATGVVPRGQLEDDTLLYTGKVNGADSTVLPFPVTSDVLQRGQQRFEIYCAPCHGRLGNGDGMIVRRGFTTPPTFHQDRLRNAPVGHFFDVITNGYGAMPDYAAQIPVRDRWAIITYIRALQLSQNATLDDVPPEARPQLQTPGPTK